MNVSDQQSPFAIRLQDAGIQFRLQTNPTHTLKETVINIVRRKHGYRTLWAVRHVNLDIARGEVIGIVGPNGSGKSTLLKLVAGVLQPSEGKREVNGTLAALIELGAGFHPELTGRENVFLGGAILGYSKAQIREKYERIVEFAELQDFMDVAVKNYSSGMYARLAFALATDVEPDVLLVDEILSVGDMAFQRKSQERLESFRRTGRTIVLVSHDMNSVKSICTRVAVMHRGAIQFVGAPDAAFAVYEKLLTPEAALGNAAPENP